VDKPPTFKDLHPEIQKLLKEDMKLMESASKMLTDLEKEVSHLRCVLADWKAMFWGMGLETTTPEGDTYLDVEKCRAWVLERRYGKLNYGPEK